MASKCVEQSVCILLSELLGKDEAVRDVLKKKGFSIKQQALVTLRHEDASLFIHEVSRPRLTSRLPSSRPTSSPPSSARSASSRAEVNNEDTSSSEEKISTPRDPTIVSARKDEPSDFECPEDAILALSKGPLIVLVLEKENAIKDLIELVGPSNPDLWTSAPASSSLRAKFGLNAQTLGVRCSKHESTVTQEIEFLFDRSGSGNRENRRRSEMGRMVKSAEVHLEDLMNFLFPSHVQHPNSVGRLFVFGLYGPLDRKSRLRSGEKGLHVVTDIELDIMSATMEREDILAVYQMCSLSQEEEEDVIRMVDVKMKMFPRYTKSDILKLFEKIPRHENGTLSFHAMQQAIMKERCRRVLCMKHLVNPSLSPPVQAKYKKTLSRLTKTKYEVAPASMFLKDVGLDGSESAVLASRLLNNYSFQICQLEDGNLPSLTQNVRLLREDIFHPKDQRNPWDPYFGLQKT